MDNYGYKNEKNKLIINGEEIKVKYYEANSDSTHRMKVKFKDGIHEVNVVKNVNGFIDWVGGEDRLGEIFYSINGSDGPVDLESIEEFQKTILDYEDWVNEEFDRDDPDYEYMFEDENSIYPKLYMKSIRVYFGSVGENDIVRIIDPAESSFCVCNESTLEYNTADGFYYECNGKVFRFDMSFY